MVQAILKEIALALEELKLMGKTHMIFFNKTGLTQEDKEKIHAILGLGQIRIKMEQEAEPAEWQESGVPGVWMGVIYDSKGNPSLETIEIARCPELVLAQPEDIQNGCLFLRSCLADRKEEKLL